jgi:hypothetical protein
VADTPVKTGNPIPDAPPPKARRPLGTRILLGLGGAVVAALLLVAAYSWIALHFDYSNGERAGYVQKFSRKGWVCKTWEGDLALVNLPGQPAEIFRFSVRDAGVAAQIDALVGRRVALTYEQHLGVPTACFGETSYFVTAVRSVE